MDATCIKSSSDRKQQTGRRDITGRQRRETRAATSSVDLRWVATKKHGRLSTTRLGTDRISSRYKRWVASGWCWCRRWADVLSAFWSPFLHVEYRVHVHVVGIIGVIVARFPTYLDSHVSRQGRCRDGVCLSCLSVASTLPLRCICAASASPVWLSIVVVFGSFGGWMMGSIKSNG